MAIIAPIGSRSRSSRWVDGVLFDFGNTLSNQASEVRGPDGVLVAVDLIPGAIETLEALIGRGYPLGLVADGRAADLRAAISQHDLGRRFDAIAISEEVGAEKPDPRIFEAALAEMGLAHVERSRVVVVGNRLERDVRGAANAGMTSVWIDWSPRYAKEPRDSTEVPDYRIREPLELLPLLHRLEHPR